MISVCGNSINCCQVQDASCRPSLWIEKVQSPRSTRGVGPADNTGNPFSRYWPGGNGLLGACRFRPKNPLVRHPGFTYGSDGWLLTLNTMAAVTAVRFEAGAAGTTAVFYSFAMNRSGGYSRYETVENGTSTREGNAT